jgi:molecular chaperone DnaK
MSLRMTVLRRCRTWWINEFTQRGKETSAGKFVTKRTSKLSDRSAGTDSRRDLSYYLGIDLGTTYTAAAVWRDARVEIASLGSRSAVIPSVVWLNEQGDLITGEAAERRAASSPLRVAREFKRRFGDPTPVFLGGTPYSADALTAALLRSVVDLVVEREDEQPAGIAISHPANWGEFKQDLLRQAIHQADLDDVELLTEPEAAAIHYASKTSVDKQSAVAVYDLGGGTFDAAVLQRTNTRWALLGQPEGIERLGGVDFDQAVFQHVVGAIGVAYDCLQDDDPTALAGVTRLRRDCVDAKEALTSDTDVSIPVLLPTIHTSVRLTRREFEDMIRPALSSSINALHRALRSAGVAPDDVSSVLLVGGSSRIPLVGQLVGSAFGRPISVDAHPKHGVALGAAIVAADRAQPHTVITHEVEPLDDAVPASVFWAPVKTSTVFHVTTPADPSAPTTVTTLTEPPTAATAAAAAAAPATGATVAVATVPPEEAPAKDGGEKVEQGHAREAVGLLIGGLAVLVVTLGSILFLSDKDDSGDPASPPAVITNGEAPMLEGETQSGRTTTSSRSTTTTTTDPERPAPPLDFSPVTTDRPPSTSPATTTTTSTTTTTEPPPTTTTTTEPPPTSTTLPSETGTLRAATD